MKSCPTYTATLYIGLQKGYEEVFYTVEDAMEVCQSYCNAIGLGVSVTPTTFVYTHGREPGVAVGLINYPRFESDAQTVLLHTVSLAELLMKALQQHRVSIVTPETTYLLEAEDAQAQ